MTMDSFKMSFTRYAVCVSTLLATALASTSVLADYEVTLCDNCSSSQYGQAAMDVGCPSETNAYVVNRPDQITRAFTFICSYDPGHVIEEAIEIDGDPDVKADIDQVLDFRAAVKSLDTVPSAGLPLPPGSPTPNGALDIVNQAGMNNVRVGVQNYFEQEYLGMLSGLFLSPSALLSLISGLINGKTFTVEFPNGSTYKFEIKFAVNFPSADIEIHSVSAIEGIDAQGRPIPETPQGFTGISRGGPSAPGYRNVAQGAGIPVLLRSCLATAQFSCSIQGNQLICYLHLAC